MCVCFFLPTYKPIYRRTPQSRILYCFSLAKFEPVSSERDLDSPTLFQATLTITTLEELRDTYLDMQDWTRGVVFVNGFNLGRYSRLSPYLTLYLPGPLLHLGQNQVSTKNISELVMAI